MPKEKSLPYVVVRTYSAGVHFGELADRTGKEVTLKNARRLWRWFGANTLNEVATKGVSRESKVSDPVPQVFLTEAIEIITCSPEGEAALREAQWAK
jgi:hypothetical protein